MQFGIHFGKAKGHSKAIVNFTKNTFATFKRFIPKQSFSSKLLFELRCLCGFLASVRKKTS